MIVIPKTPEEALEVALSYFQAGMSFRECENLTNVNFMKVRREAEKRGIVKGSSLNSNISRRPSFKPPINIVYLVTANEYEGIYKLGITSNITTRLASLQTSHPYKLYAYRCYVCDNPPSIEMSLHIFFKKKRLEGEWFKFTEMDIKYLDEAMSDG